MRWPAVLGRFQGLFAEAVEWGEDVAAEGFAEIAFEVRRLGDDRVCAIHDLLDYLEMGELARIEMRSLESSHREQLAAIANDYVEMFREHAARHGRQDCKELAVPYVAVPSTRRSAIR